MSDTRFTQRTRANNRGDHRDRRTRKIHPWVNLWSPYRSDSIVHMRRDINQNTPLHLAVWEGESIKTISRMILLDPSAVWALNWNGLIPFDYATIRNASRSVLRMLLLHMKATTNNEDALPHFRKKIMLWNELELLDHLNWYDRRCGFLLAYRYKDGAYKDVLLNIVHFL